jgi:hypothetical protein
MLDAIDLHSGIPAALKEEAKAVAKQQGGPSAEQLNGIAWRIVSPSEGTGDDPTKALTLARAAVELRDISAYRDTLAWALFANGLFLEAVEESRLALDMASESRKQEYQNSLNRMQAMVAERTRDFD